LAHNARRPHGRAGPAGEGDRDDPNYGQALSVLAASHMSGVHLGWADLSKAATHCRTRRGAGGSAGPRGRLGPYALGSVYFSTRRLDDALSELEWALHLNPNFCLAQGYYALALSLRRPVGDAFEAAQRAIRLSPRDPSLAIYYGIAGYARFTARRYDEAIALAREAIRHRGDLTGAYRVLAVSAGMSGDTTPPKRHFWSFAARSRTSPFPGSQPNCPGGTNPTGSIIWRGFAGRVDVNGTGFEPRLPFARHASRVRERPTGLGQPAAANRHAAALGAAPRGRNGAAQVWPAAGLAC